MDDVLCIGSAKDMYFINGKGKATKEICSLALPTLSEGEMNILEEMLQEYRKIYAHGGMNREQTDTVSKRMGVLESVHKALIKPKEE